MLDNAKDEHQVKSLNIKGAPNPVEFPLNINAQDFTQWDLPGGAAARFGKGATYDMDYSPNGDLLAVGTSTGAWLYDAHTGEELALLRWGGQDNNSVSAVRFSQDGKTLATTFQGHSELVVLWDVATRTQKPGIVATGAVKSVNHDGTLLATRVFGRGSGTVVWDVATGTRKYSFGSNTAVVSLSPDHRTLAVFPSSHPSGVYLWDLTTGERIATLPGIDVSVYSISFSADGRTLAAGADDGKIYLWDVAAQTVRTVLTGHADSRSNDVVSVSFSPDGRTLASGGSDGTARLWDVASGAQIAILSGHIGRVSRVRFGRDDKTLASYGLEDRIVHQWDIATGFPKFTISGHLISGAFRDRYVMFSPDGKTLARVGSDDGAIHLWDVATGRQRASLNGCLGVSQYILSASFSPDGATLASAGSDGMVRIWDVASGRETAVLEHDRSVESVSFSPNGDTLASSGRVEVRLWSVRAWTERAVIAHDSRVYGVRFSPDSRTLATIVNGDKDVHLWNVDTGTWIGALKGHTAPVSVISFSPDRGSRILASGAQDETVRLWNVDTMKETGSLAHTGDVHSVSFSADGKTLASADGTLRLWDLEIHKEIEGLTGNTERVGSVTFSPDGKALASVGGRGDPGNRAVGC